MTTWGNAELLVEMLDRQFEFLVAQQNERRVLLVTRWLAFLKREPQLAGLAAELLEETKLVLREFTLADHKVREQIAAVWQQHGRVVRDLLVPALGDEALHAYCRLDEFEEAVARRPTVALPEWLVFDESRSETDDLAHALLHWSTWAVQNCERGNAAVPDALFEVRDRGKEAELTLQFLRRRFRTAIESLPGAALRRLGRIVRKATPAPPRAVNAEGDEDLAAQAMRLAVFERTNEFASKVHSNESRRMRQLENDEVTAAADCIAEDVELLTHELQLRLLAGRSRIALVRRYAARCEGFDAEDLRTSVLANPGGIERHLTLNFAKYLFEQGLTPLMDATTGGLRPDVIDVAPGGLLYVEAKQYGEAAPRGALRAAYRQVWSTWGRLANAHKVPEAFLLVFRVGGPRVELPLVLRHSGRTLYSVLVDISLQGGSREKETSVSFEDAELLPETIEPTSEASS